MGCLHSCYDALQGTGVTVQIDEQLSNSSFSPVPAMPADSSAVCIRFEEIAESA